MSMDCAILAAKVAVRVQEIVQRFEAVSESGSYT